MQPFRPHLSIDNKRCENHPFPSLVRDEDEGNQAWKCFKSEKEKGVNPSFVIFQLYPQYIMLPLQVSISSTGKCLSMCFIKTGATFPPIVSPASALPFTLRWILWWWVVKILGEAFPHSSDSWLLANAHVDIGYHLSKGFPTVAAFM